jgi:hypothetical protein
MKLPEFRATMTAIAPQGITEDVTYCGTYSAAWNISDEDGDAVRVSVSNSEMTHKAVVCTLDEANAFAWRPDHLMWLGTLGGLLQQLELTVY